MNIIKYTFEDANKTIKAHGFKLISDFRDVKSKINLIDKDGYKYQTSIDYLNVEKLPRKFDKANNFTIENIKLYLLNSEIHINLLSTDYFGTKEKLLFKCHCGEIFEASFMQIKTNNKHECNKCANKKKIEKLRLDYNYIKRFYLENDLTIVDCDYFTSQKSMLVIDKDGYKIFISYNNLRSGKHGDRFSKLNPYTIDNIKLYIILNNLPCKILSGSFLGNMKPLNFMCECGSEYKTSWANFLSRQVVRCPKCSKSQSKYEFAVENYLKELNIEYQTQYKFADCKNINLLPFDFSVKLKSKTFLIEVDGETHYRGWKGDCENLKIQQHRDKIKTDYCLNKGITLVRIPYWDFKSDLYKKIIYDQIKINAS